MSVVILDLDGTISDDRWRLDRIKEHEEDNFTKYHEYHSLAPWDEPVNSDLYRGVRHDLVVFTVRPNLYYHSTKEWLRRHGIPVVGLLMRDINDFRDPPTVKSDMLDKLYKAHLELRGSPGPKIERAVDDNEEIVKMYRSRGVKAKLRGIK